MFGQLHLEHPERKKRKTSSFIFNAQNNGDTNTQLIIHQFVFFINCVSHHFLNALTDYSQVLNGEIVCWLLKLRQTKCEIAMTSHSLHVVVRVK